MAMPQGIVGLVDTIKAAFGRSRGADELDVPPTDGLAEGSQ